MKKILSLCLAIIFLASGSVMTFGNNREFTNNDIFYSTQDIVSSGSILVLKDYEINGIGVCEQDNSIHNSALDNNIMLNTTIFENAEGYDENCTTWENSNLSYYQQLGKDAANYGAATEEIYKSIYLQFKNKFIGQDLSDVYIMTNENGETHYVSTIEINLQSYGIINNNTNRRSVLRAFQSARAAFYGDYPEFFAGWEDEIECVVNGNYITMGRMNIRMHEHYNKEGDRIYLTSNELETRKNESLDVAEHIINEMNSKGFVNQYDKIYYLFKEVCEMTEYHTTSNYSNDIDGVFCDGETACLGYSRAFQLLCQMANIPCITATGGGHAWNFVKVDGYWYIADATDADVRHNVYGYDYDYDRFLIQRNGNISYNRFKELGNNSTPDLIQYFGYPEVSEIAYLLGDVDLNRILTANDAALIMAYVINPSEANFTKKQELNADYNRDGLITSADASAVYSKVLGVNVTMEELFNGVKVINQNMAKIDYNKDGKVDYSDVLIDMAKYVKIDSVMQVRTALNMEAK